MVYLANVIVILLKTLIPSIINMVYKGPHVFEIREGKLNTLKFQCIHEGEMGPWRTTSAGLVFSESIAEAYRDSVRFDLEYVTKKIFNERYYIRESNMRTLHKLAEYYEFDDLIGWFKRYWTKIEDESFFSQLPLEGKNRPNIEYNTTELIADFKNDMYLSDIGQELIDAKINYLEERNTNLSSHISKLEANYTRMEDQDYEGWIIEHVKEIDKYEKLTGKYRSDKITIAHLQGKYNDDKIIITDEMISLAKKVPFDKLLKLETLGARKRCVCPFHNDKNPSFYIYPDTNRGYCHGCGKSVDTIQYMVEIKNMDFNQAVLMLLSY